MKKNKYGFIDKSKLPPNPKHEGSLEKLDEAKWVTVGMFHKQAKNHCGAVCGSNLARYFGFKFKNLFTLIHKIIGNGPVVFLTWKLKKFFKTLNYKLISKKSFTFESFKEAIDNNQPAAILLCRHPFNWHWVLGVGYVEYDNKKRYIQIVDGWKSSHHQYYEVNKNSYLMSITSYSIQDI